MGAEMLERATPIVEGVNRPSSDETPRRASRRTAKSLLVAIVAIVGASLLIGLGVATGQVARSSHQFTPPETTPPETKPNLSSPRAVDEPSVRRVARVETSKSARTTAPSQASGELQDQPSESFDGRPVRLARIVRMRVTAYSPDAKSCGSSADGITASGYSVATNGGALVAADPTVLALGSLVVVPGYEQGAVVPVLDTGGAIRGNRLDVLFPTHEEARRWGVRDLDVRIYEYADGRPNGFRKFRRRS